MGVFTPVARPLLSEKEGNVENPAAARAAAVFTAQTYVPYHSALLYIL